MANPQYRPPHGDDSTYFYYCAFCGCNESPLNEMALFIPFGQEEAGLTTVYPYCIDCAFHPELLQLEIEDAEERDRDDYISEETTWPSLEE